MVLKQKSLFKSFGIQKMWVMYPLEAPIKLSQQSSLKTFTCIMCLFTHRNIFGTFILYWLWQSYRYFNVALCHFQLRRLFLVSATAKPLQWNQKLTCTDLYIRTAQSIRVLSEYKSVKSCAQVVHVRAGIVLVLFLWKHNRKE